MGLVTKVNIAQIQDLLPFKAKETLGLLLEYGISAEVAFYSVVLKKPETDQYLSITLPTSSVTLVSGKATPSVQALAITALSDLVHQAYDQWFEGEMLTKPVVYKGATAPKEKSLTAVEALTAAMGIQAQVQAPTGVGSITFTPGSVPEVLVSEVLVSPKKKTVHFSGKEKDGVAKLRFALHIGQQVAGTSPTSTYRVVALSDRVNVACRIDGNNLSVRVEGEPNTFEAGKLTAMGLIKNAGGHWSVHLDCTNVPVARVVGAVLMDLGIVFKEQAKNLQEVFL